MTVKSRPGLTRARRLFKFESTIRHPDSESSQSLLPCRRGCHCHVERRAAVEVGPAAAARNELTRRLRRYTAATFSAGKALFVSGVQVRCMPLRSQQCVQQVALWHPPGHHLVQTLRP